MYENLELDLDLKLLFMVAGAYHEYGLSYECINCNLFVFYFCSVEELENNKLGWLAILKVRG